MTMKSFLTVGALALASLTIASAKTYDFKLDGPAKVGDTELKAGQYKVKVDGTQATLTNLQTAKSFTTPVKIESNDKKFDQTMVLTHNDNGADNLREIDLGGSTTRVEFSH